jgi:T5SS/PEP-CTERM-associated repeat protein
LTLQDGVTYQGGATLQVGNVAGTTGSLIVQGSGTSAIAISIAGLAGQTNIQVLDGAKLASTGPGGVQLGGGTTTSSGGISNVAVSGQGSTFTTGVQYTQHQGTLEVSNGGVLQSKLMALGLSIGDSFTGVVTGAGSTLATTVGALNLGASGTATLSVGDGATLSASKSINLAANAAGSATLNIGAPVGSAVDQQVRFIRGQR